jgi:hypothetical protein
MKPYYPELDARLERQLRRVVGPKRRATGKPIDGPAFGWGICHPHHDSGGTPAINIANHGTGSGSWIYAAEALEELLKTLPDNCPDWQEKAASCLLPSHKRGEDLD